LKNAFEALWDPDHRAAYDRLISKERSGDGLAIPTGAFPRVVPQATPAPPLTRCR